MASVLAVMGARASFYSGETVNLNSHDIDKVPGWADGGANFQSCGRVIACPTKKGSHKGSIYGRLTLTLVSLQQSSRARGLYALLRTFRALVVSPIVLMKSSHAAL